ncbi:hypothetical protein ACN28I_38670 [Archangium gephyra]|uniref:hypothetical protein n=1 Tax=Archangium gephyra TaxID=48 RepID=UPI003B813A13
MASLEGNLGGFPRPLPEKQPYKWQELTEHQKRVARCVHEWMVHFVNASPARVEPHDRGPFSWSAEEVYRTPNVVLVDGARGSGKTSVLLTLLELWRRPIWERLDLGPWGERQKARDAYAPESDLSPDKGRSHWEEEWLEEPRWIGWQLIPLRPLDLHPLPRDVSLFAWIASRLLKFVELDEEVEGESGDRAEYIGPSLPIASWNPDVEHEPKSKRAWREFIRDAASGWDSNLEQRKASLDPEAYAVELEQAELARHTIVESWQRFVNAVLEDTRARFGGLVRKDARLVIPIDDADMNPERCVEVLNAVRVLWHPRVVFLLTGNSRLFIKMLRLQQYGALREKLHAGSLQDIEIQSIESRPTAQELAVQAYDKVIPPGQRFSLEDLLPSERLKYLRRFLHLSLKPPEVRNPEAEARERAEWMRRQKEAGGACGQEEWDEHVNHEVERLGVPALSELLRKFDVMPFLREGLPLHLRRIRNLAWSMAMRTQEKKLEAHRELEEKQLERQLDLIHMLWWDAVENWPLSRTSDKGLRNAIRLEAYTPNDARAVDAPPLRQLRISSQAPVKWHEFPVERFPSLDGRFSCEVCITGHFIWRMRASDEREAPDYLTMLFLLALERATAEQAGSSAAAFMPRGLQAPFVRLAHPLEASGQHVVFSWPLPDWSTLRQLVEFETRWSERWRKGWNGELGRMMLGASAQSESREHQEEALEHQEEELFRTLVQSFLAAVLDAHGTSGQEQGHTPLAQDIELEEVVKELTTEVRRLLFEPAQARSNGTAGGIWGPSEAEQRNRALAEWFLERAILLAAPESGLPERLARELLLLWIKNSPGPGPVDPSRKKLPPWMRQKAEQGRLKRAGQVLEALAPDSSPESPEELLRELDGAWWKRHGHLHPWMKYVEAGMDIEEGDKTYSLH